MDDDGSRFVEAGHEHSVSERGWGDVQRGNQSVIPVCPVQLTAAPATVVKRQSVDDVVDAVELGGRRVGHDQRIYRLAAYTCTDQPTTWYVHS